MLSSIIELAARVSDIVYLGTAVRLVLSLADGLGLTAELGKDAVEKSGAKPGVVLRLWARAQDVIVFDAARSGHDPH